MNKELKETTKSFIKMNGFDELTKVQEEVLKYTSSHKDVIALSKTGTGKTHAYLIPIMEMINPVSDKTQVLISVPTRELAYQVYQNCLVMKEVFAELRIQLLSGGTDKKKSISKLEKKPHIPLIILGAILAVCLGYLVNGAWKEGMEFVDFLNSLNDVLSNPLRDYFNEYTPKAIVSAVVIYLIIVVMYYTSQKNYMPGREYGTAIFVPPYVINRVIAENGEFENRILSQGVRMSLNTELTGFNNNIII